MTPHTHDYEFAALPTVDDRAPRRRRRGGAKRSSRRRVVEVGETCATPASATWRRFSDPDGNRILLHRRYAPYPDGTTP